MFKWGDRSGGVSMCELQAGGKYMMPNGVTVTARASRLRDVAMELVSVGGWGVWLITRDGQVVSWLGAHPKGKQLRVHDTGWRVGDVLPAGDGAA